MQSEEYVGIHNSEEQEIFLGEQSQDMLAFLLREQSEEYVDIHTRVQSQVFLHFN